MIVELLTLGNEILDGRRVDTNTAWIGRFLTGLGLEIRYRQSTQDRKQDIADAFRLAISRSDLIISTGGLGPTQDDVTFEGLALAIDQPLVYHSDLFEVIRKKYELRKLPCPESNQRQAWLPKSAIPIPAIGTAPGCFINVQGKMIFCFPGVPSEMQHMFQSFFVEKIRALKSLKPIFQIGYSISGLGESFVEEKLRANKLDIHEKTDLNVAYTASSSDVDVTFTFTPQSEVQKREIVSDIHERFSKTFSGYLTKWEGKPVEEHVIDWLVQKKWTLGVAESITGGMITSRFVNVPGCSSVLDRGVVAYGYQAKKDLLDVQQETLKNFGAISVECVLEMARGLKTKSGMNITVSICGIAGPGGGSEKKPVGLTYICWLGPAGLSGKYVKCTNFEKKVGPGPQNADMNNRTNDPLMFEEHVFQDERGFARVRGYKFTGDRDRNRILATNKTLVGLYDFIRQYDEA